MPFQTFFTEDEYQFYCPFWAHVNARLAELYQPNPWLFKSGYRLFPQDHQYLLTYRNFDDSQTITVKVSYSSGEITIDV